MDKKFKQIYYSDDGYWRGKSVIQRLAKASGSTKEEAEKWLLKQPLYQIYLPAPKYIPIPNASMSLFAKPNDIRQSDLLSLPHDKFKKKTYKYALNIVDVVSRYKGSYQLTTKNAKEVAQAFQWIYENTPLNYPKTLIVDDGKEFYGDMTKLMERHDVIIQRGDPSQHRSQGIMERFNRTLADRLFTYQYHKELELIGMKPIDAIKQTLVEQGFSQPIKLKSMKRNYLMLVPRLDIFTSLVNSRGINTKVKGGNDLLTPYGQWMCIKSKIDSFKSINQHCTT